MNVESYGTNSVDLTKNGVVTPIWSAENAMGRNNKTCGDEIFLS